MKARVVAQLFYKQSLEYAVTSQLAALDGPDSRPCKGQCVVFLVKTLNSHTTDEVYAGGNPEMGKHPIQGGVEIFLVDSCHRNRDKLWPDGPLGSADLMAHHEIS